MPWLAFAVSFFVVGLPYWQTPYNKVNLPSTLLDYGLIVVVLAALLVRWLGNSSLTKTIVVGASVPAAVMARVMVDTAKDPTSHNLWPFELVIALVVGFAASAAGALIGSLLARLLRPSTQERDPDNIS